MKKLYPVIKQLCFSALMLALLSIAQNINGQLVNPGFETGDLSGWTGSAGTSVSAGRTVLSWTVNPVGNYMASIEPTLDFMIGAAESNLGLPAGALMASNSGLYSTATNFATLTQGITLSAGDTIIIHWNFIAQDYAPFNDGVIATLVGPSYQNIQLLAVTANPFGDLGAIVTGDYGSTGWHTVMFTVTESGSYTLGFASFNTGDQDVNPILIIDDGVGGTSAPNEAIVITDNVTAIGISSAISGGNVTSSGGSAVTKRGVCWSTSELPTISDSLSSDGSGIGIFTSNITGLLPGTEYYVRAYATNSISTAYGPQKIFTTLSLPSVPKVSTTSVSSILQTTASAGGEVISENGNAVTARGVCWNISGSPTILDSITSDGSGIGSFSSSITGLSPGTTYYMKSYATNSVGTGYGSEISFTTLKNVQTISFNALDTKIYGDSDFDLGATASSGLSVTYSSSNTSVATIIGNVLHILSADTVTVFANQAGNAAFDAAPQVNQILTINRKKLTVVGAKSANKIYDGNTDAVISDATLSGIVGSDDVTLSDTTSGVFASSDAGTGISVTTSMTLKGVTVGNYTLIQPTLNANIIAKELTVVGAKSANKVYDGNTDAVISDATLSSIVGSDDVTLSDAKLGTYASANVGTGISITSAMTLKGPDAKNYTLTQPDLKADILVRPLEISANTGQTKVVGNEDKELAYTITQGSLVNGELLSGSLSRASGETVGNYPILIGTLSAGDNYSISFVSADFVIYSITGLEIPIISKIGVYPNPTNGIFTVDSKEGQIQLLNLEGKIIVETLSNNNNIIDISNQPAGIYILILTTNGNIYKYKIVRK
jgi:hypothetical protein